MVGVPRSKGCSTCIQRRVKCDETRPECQRCQTRGTACPGYARDRKFLHAYSRPETRATPQPRTSIDGVVAPSLAGAALAQQYRESFCAFLETKFPGQYYGYSTRVGVNWFEVARNYHHSAGKALDWSLRSIGALQIGRVQHDPRLVVASREMYGQALHQLGRTLANPALVTTDSTLAAAILLGAYEMSNMSGQRSWMLHSRGISYLYQLRGARAHTDGLGRTLLSSFRGFLVFEALLRGEPCFLEDKDWKSIIPDTIREERQRGKTSRLGELIEYAFHEVARCPGFLVRTRALVASARPNGTVRDDLVKSIVECQQTLHNYQSELCAGMADGPSKSERNDEFVGPIPSRTADTLGRHSLQGVSSAIALLQQLRVVLKSDRARRDTHALNLDLKSKKDPWKVIDHSSVAQSIRMGTCYGKPAGPRREQEPDQWFDRVSMTMGMLEESAPFPT